MNLQIDDSEKKNKGNETKTKDFYTKKRMRLKSNKQIGKNNFLIVLNEIVIELLLFICFSNDE